MRLDRVAVNGFKNLKHVEVDFDENHLTTVIVGQNGAGKSNLIEAIADVFRFVDLNRGAPRFNYEINYRIGERKIRLANPRRKPAIFVDDRAISRAAFEAQRADLFPDLIFGYYSGGSSRLERLFDSHQRRYYDVISKDRPGSEYRVAQQERRLFYCRPIHGVLALISFFAFPDPEVRRLLNDKLGVAAFHSALALLKEPTWFNYGQWSRGRSKLSANGNGKRRRDDQAARAHDVWGSKGPAGACGRALLHSAFHPVALRANIIDDYREKQRAELQLACFLKDRGALHRFSSAFGSDQDMFAALEALDISGLLRDLQIWVERPNEANGDVSFADLSDGERQLLMVLGLIRISRGKRALFLLDEPDTHLNPAWQISYLDLIREWTGAAGNEADCQILMTSHNPLTIAALDAAQVRVMSVDKKGAVSVKAPYVDPRGLGFAGVLTDVFGMASTLDRPTQQLIDQRNRLAREENLSADLLERLESINAQLRHLGFLYQERDSLYSLFLRMLDEVELADMEPLTADEMRARDEEAREIVEELLSKR